MTMLGNGVRLSFLLLGTSMGSCQTIPRKCTVSPSGQDERSGGLKERRGDRTQQRTWSVGQACEVREVAIVRILGERDQGRDDGEVTAHLLHRPSLGHKVTRQRTVAH